MTPDPTKVITDVRAVFPLGEATTAAVRDLVTTALANAIQTTSSYSSYAG